MKELDALNPARRELALGFADRSRFDAVERFNVLFGLGIAIGISKFSPPFSNFDSHGRLQKSVKGKARNRFANRPKLHRFEFLA